MALILKGYYIQRLNLPQYPAQAIYRCMSGVGGPYLIVINDRYSVVRIHFQLDAMKLLYYISEVRFESFWIVNSQILTGKNNLQNVSSTIIYYTYLLILNIYPEI